MRWVTFWLVATSATTLQAQVCELHGSGEVRARVAGHALTVEADSIGVIVEEGAGQAKIVGSLAFLAMVYARDLPLRTTLPHVGANLVWERQVSRERVRLSTELQCGKATVEVRCDSIRIRPPRRSGSEPPNVLKSLWGGRRRAGFTFPVNLRTQVDGAFLARVQDVTFQRIDQRADWLLLEARDDMTLLRGWARRVDLDVYTSIRRCQRTPQIRMGWAPDMQYAARAVVQPGTEVYDAPNGEPWAHTIETDGYIVRAQPNSQWAQLVVVPRMGTAADFEQHAWVRRDRVTFLVTSPRMRRR